MGRPRTKGVHLPPGVQIVRKGVKTYYYWAPGKGTANAGRRIALGSDPHHPDFWAALRRAQDIPDGDAGTFAALIAEYKASPEWARLRPATQANYESNMARIIQAAGTRPVRDLLRRDVYLLRDSMMATPASANKMISVLKMLVEWSIPRGHREDNPVSEVKVLKMDVKGASPWPEQAYAHVLAHAPADLRRLAILGRATGQRETDLIAMSPAHLDHDGIRVRISKLRDKDHFVPLTAEQMREIRSWGVEGLDVFVKTPKGERYTPMALRSRWKRWKNEQPALQGMKVTIHGLRATAVCDRRLAGAPDGSIADELGMSVAMVSRYAKFADKTAAARASRDRREGQVVKMKKIK